MAVVANSLLIVLSLIMGARLLQQYSVKHRTHTLWYAVGLLLTAVAAFPELYGKITGQVSTPLWWLYWICASSLVGFLAAGTAYLLGPTWGKVTIISVAVVTALLVAATITTAGSGPAYTETVLSHAPTGWIKAPFLIQNIAGAMLILIGALYSYYRTRWLYNIWIALGTMIFSAGGAAAGILTFPGVFYFTQTAGIILLYLGVMQSVAPRRTTAALG